MNRGVYQKYLEMEKQRKIRLADAELVEDKKILLRQAMVHAQAFHERIRIAALKVPEERVSTVAIAIETYFEERIIGTIVGTARYSHPELGKLQRPFPRSIRSQVDNP